MNIVVKVCSQQAASVNHVSFIKGGGALKVDSRVSSTGCTMKILKPETHCFGLFTMREGPIRCNLVKAPPCDLLEKWAQMYFKCFIPLLGTPSAPVFQRLMLASHMIVIGEQLLTNLSKSWQHQHSAVCRRQQSGLVNKILRQLDGLDLRGIYLAGLLELKSCCRPITFAAAVLAAP